MIRIYIILSLLPLFSCGQTNFMFKLEKSYPVSLDKAVCISVTDCFCLSSYSNIYNLMIYYSDEECETKRLIDTVEFSPYNSTIHSFKSKKNNSYVVLLETEYEYIPLIQAYYITEGKLAKIGELKISLPCQSCESFEYPIKEIQILQENEEIEISFLKDVNYKDKDSSEWKLSKAGALKYSFNTVSGELRKKIDR